MFILHQIKKIKYTKMTILILKKDKYLQLLLKIKIIVKEY